VLEVEPSPTGSRVTHLLGGYEDYLERKMRQLAETSSKRSSPEKASEKPNSAPEPTQPAKRPEISNNQKRSWERERDQLEKDITHRALGRYRDLRG
jgi:hypothetical protein